MARMQPPFGNRNNQNHGRQSPYHPAVSEQGASPIDDRFVYDPYGLRKQCDSKPSLGDDDLGWHFQFQGGAFDPAIGLIDFANRAYSPTMQRWLQRDPLGYVEPENIYECPVSHLGERHDAQP